MYNKFSYRSPKPSLGCLAMWCDWQQLLGTSKRQVKADNRMSHDINNKFWMVTSSDWVSMVSCKQYWIVENGWISYATSRTMTTQWNWVALGCVVLLDCLCRLDKQLVACTRSYHHLLPVTSRHKVDRSLS